MAVHHDIGMGKKCIFDTAFDTFKVEQHKVCTHKAASDEPAKNVFLMV